MIRSMTGFGEAERSTAAGRLRVELRTVNHRFLNVNTRLPSALTRWEPELREWLRGSLSRGHVNCTLRLEAETGAGETVTGYRLDEQRVAAYLAVFRELSERFGAPGDFARAYVIAHEVGHHVQNLTGAMGDFQGYAASGPGSSAVRMELQADCFAGIWAAHIERAGDILEEGDIEEGLNAAAAIGDDRLQRQAQGHVVPDSFTHGTSDQRVRWFRRGMEGADVNACDTFEAEAL